MSDTDSKESNISLESIYPLLQQELQAKMEIFLESLDQKFDRVQKDLLGIRAATSEIKESVSTLHDGVRELDDGVRRNSHTLDAIFTKAIEGNGVSFPAEMRPRLHSRIRPRHDPMHGTIPVPYAG